MTGDRQRRPGTIPPGSLQVAAPAPAPAPTPTPPTATASVSSRIELSPEDLLNESGNWTRGGQPSGKSATTLRRVRVLTDPLKRTGEISALTPVARPPDESSDSSLTRAPDSSLTRAPAAARSAPGDLIIGGTREELEAASRATTVRLDPASAAAAVQAANGAAVAELERSNNALSELARAAVGDTSVPESPPPGDTSGAPASNSGGRRRSSAVSSSGHAEPRDWGTIPPISPPPAAAIVPAPPRAAELAPEARPTSKLIPILVLVALVLLAIVFAAS